MPGTLYLIPTVIAEGTNDHVLSPQVKNVLPSLSYFLVEEVRTARRFLSSLKVFDSIEPLRFEVLNKDTADADLPQLLKPLLDGEDVGLLSESGCPGVADPGSKAVFFAHQKKIRVVPIVGPSSILLALMASGLNGQQFAFHGYFPIEPKELATKIKELERESKAKKQTQIFIETPYRNQSLFEQLLKNLNNETLLSVSYALTGQLEKIQTRTIAQWKSDAAAWAKEPAVFLFLA
jgi:16S rRNA (cytidine1402-2'-O)-methyltransferase